MNITPKEFLELLRSSSLSRDEQKALIKLLPSLKSGQIDQIADVLRKDAKAVQTILIEQRFQQEKELLKLNSKLDQLSK